ncbi:hypothetical protein [Novosphingobium sp.]|jgi:hypothetical protein|uniref:hypothetical protein n=1 Tax=Novosphingobium sp. TaxID=1874826 RepID=UPI002FDF24E6
MFTKRSDAYSLTPCWFSRVHEPDGRREREDDGTLICTCRYCRKRIRSREGKTWNLADGLDLDALAASCISSHFSVIDVEEGMVLARYKVPPDADELAIEDMRAVIAAKHDFEEGGDLEIRLIRHEEVLQKRH